MTRAIFRGIAIATALFWSLAGAEAQAPQGFELALVDLDGNKKVLGELPASTYAPRISPDGKRVAFETRDPSGPDGARIWTADITDIAARRPLPSVAGPVNWAPLWTLDGRRLVFIVSGAGPDAIWWRNADGTGEAEHLIDTRAGEGWIGDGTHLRFLSLTGNGDYGIATLDMRTREITRVIDLPGSAQHSSNMSPDGKWMAYASNETGRYEVWIEPFPRDGTRHRVTRDGGSHPMWAPHGKSIYFDRDHQLFELSVTTADLNAVGEPVPLPIKGFAQAEYRRQFDLMPNGTQFMVMLPKN